MIDHALCSREHGVVVGHHGAARLVFVEVRAIYRADTRDHAVGRAHGAQFVEAAPVPLRSKRQAAIFDEAVRVAKVGDVFAAWFSDWSCDVAPPHRDDFRPEVRPAVPEPREGRREFPPDRCPRWRSSSPCPPSTGWMNSKGAASNTVSPDTTASEWIIPDVGATTTCSIFIASITSRGCPARTSAPLRTSIEITVPWIGKPRLRSRRARRLRISPRRPA